MAGQVARAAQAVLAVPTAQQGEQKARAARAEPTALRAVPVAQVVLPERWWEPEEAEEPWGHWQVRSVVQAVLPQELQELRAVPVAQPERLAQPVL